MFRRRIGASLTGAGLALALSGLFLSSQPRAQTGVPPLPHDVTYVMPVWLNYMGASPAVFEQQVAELRNRLGEGPLVRVGFSVYVSIEMPDWTLDPNDAAAVRAALASTIARIDAAIARARPYNLPICLNLLTAIRSAYDGAQRDSEREDRRTMQWYSDNGLARGWWTHSRYARKQYALQQAYIRELGKVLANRMARDPNILVAASGDGEVELSFDRAPGPDNAVLADYSPFAVAEFRDWLRHAGLYAPGQPFAGDGYQSGARYAGDASPAEDTNGDGHTLNGDFGTRFTSWDLRYFDWSLSDDPNADPHAIPARVYEAPGWNPMPDAGASRFDAPRVRVPGDPWWEVWSTFRSVMLWHHNRDFARWITTSPDPETGATVPAERWYSYQVPADYLFGGTPENPNWRFVSSASAWWTADISPYGSIGITAFNVNFGTWFARTLSQVAPHLAERDRRWGIIEWNPSVPTSPSLDIYTDEMAVVERYRPSLLIPYAWGHSPEQVQDTGFEVALRDLIARIKQPAPSQVVATIDAPARGASVRQPFFLTGWAVDLGTVRGPGRTTGVDRVEVYALPTDSSGGPGVFLGSATYGLSRLDVGAQHGRQFTNSGYQLNINGLPPGRYRVVVRVRSQVTDTLVDAATLDVNVDLPTLSLDRSRLTFAVTVAADGRVVGTGSQVITLTHSGSVPVAWTASSDQNWLEVTPTSGSGAQTLTLRLIPDALPPGSGSATARVTVRAAGAANEVSVEVTLTRFSGGASTPPFGFVDTPVHGATGIAGALGITGWALDDVEVARVEIYRHAVPGIDPPAAIRPNGKVYIGTATFVPGARHDVEGYYPDYPQNARAGWGYQVLTNMLPDLARCTVSGGNGLFTFYAYAIDVEGQATLLGARTVTCANASSSLPFGTIDTPAQGATIAGPSYVNFGWALTPPPKFIPTDGSTILVWIDGRPAGRVSYNHYRSDIATLFPGYANSDGAVGYYLIDTTRLANGLHTIAWSVVDNEGAAAGLGSRYFTVLNSSGSSSGAAGSEAFATSSVARGAPVSAATSHTSGSAPRFGRHALLARRGYDLSQPLLRVVPDDSGVHQLTIFENDRLEAWLPASHAPYVGYSLVGGDRRGLPVGSHLDVEHAVFYWQPSVGFMGSYLLEFSPDSSPPSSAGHPVRLLVRIVPRQPGGAIRMYIDTPLARTTVDQPFVVAGWAADARAWADAGIDTVHVWAYPDPGSGQPPIFLGAAATGGVRPDVALAFGRRFANSGYSLTVGGLAPGDYELVVFARSAFSGSFDDARRVRVNVR